MSETGRPQALNDDKRAIVCSLMAEGASLRQAARFVECDPNSIRRDAKRNDEFRRQLEKAKSEAKMQPLQTLHEAAKTDWRAALKLMERLEPERFGPKSATIATKRDVNMFVGCVVEAIDKIVSNAWEREHLFEVVFAAMSASVRPCWEGHKPRGNAQQLIRTFERMSKSAVSERRWQGEQLYQDVARYLPPDLQRILDSNKHLIPFQESTPDESPDSARNRLLATARKHFGHTADDPSAGDDSPESDSGSVT
jgi:hypothetical protein